MNATPAPFKKSNFRTPAPQTHPGRHEEVRGSGARRDPREGRLRGGGRSRWRSRGARRAGRGGPAARGRVGERRRRCTHGRVVGEGTLRLVDPVPGLGHADGGHVGDEQLAQVPGRHLRVAAAEQRGPLHAACLPPDGGRARAMRVEGGGAGAGRGGGGSRARGRGGEEAIFNPMAAAPAAAAPGGPGGGGRRGQSGVRPPSAAGRCPQGPGSRRSTGRSRRAPLRRRLSEGGGTNKYGGSALLPGKPCALYRPLS